MCHQDDRLAAPNRGALRYEVEIELPSGPAMRAAFEQASPGEELGGVLVITDIYGATPFYRGLAARLAEDGLSAVVPDYLAHQQGPLERDDRDLALTRAREVDQLQALAETGAVADWLKARVGASRIGVLGFCLGGTFALDLAAERDDLAVVSFYGFPDGVAGTNPVAAPASIVDRIGGPILAFWGEEDYMNMESVARFCAELAGYNPQFSHRIYPEVGHGFLGALEKGAAVATDSWSRTARFLRDELGAAVAGG